MPNQYSQPPFFFSVRPYMHNNVLVGVILGVSGTCNKQVDDEAVAGILDCCAEMYLCKKIFHQPTPQKKGSRDYLPETTVIKSYTNILFAMSFFKADLV